jgi:hypothetical protein
MAGSYFEKGGHGGLYLILSLVAASVILPLILVVPMWQDPEVVFSDEAMTITGMYGLTLNFSDISSSDTMHGMPPVKSRTNGYASRKLLKGHFRLHDNSKAVLFIHRGKSPYIHLGTPAKAVYLNYDDPSRTRELFSRINEKMN